MTWRPLATQVPYRFSALLALALLSAACGDDSKPNDAGPEDVGSVEGEALTTYEPCASGEDLGEFYVQLAAEYTSVGGKIYEGVVPETGTIELAREGSCWLATPLSYDCEPRCTPAVDWCNMDRTCTPWPRARDLGTVTVQGLSAPVSMTANANTKSYSAAPPVPHPGFEPGANITLSTSGGDYEPVTLRGWGVSPFELTEPVRVDRGAPTSLRWVAPADPGPARVTVNLNINVHGSNKAWIDCDLPDTGAAEISAGLIDALIEQGLTGNPTIIVTRRTASSVQIEPGCVELLVSSGVSQDVTVPGIISCNTSTPCPDGMTCRAVEQFCE